ncbi:MAG: DUF3307 domain-containing protein [Candidatus Omnitrophica bacterium]|nr:DUF3307 domain-containing protein [Candidatus Omnitrophota bacterium]
MFIFLKLILAHLIADFILQFEELYQLKVRSFLGQLLHVLIHGLVSLLLLYPYLNAPTIWLFVAGLVLIHLGQDLIKYTFTQKTPTNTFVYFMTDQFCHVLAISAIFLFPISHEVRGFPAIPFLDSIYRTNLWTLGAIFFITLTFAGSYILNAFAKSYLKERAPLYLISSPEIAHAILERSLIAWILLAGTSPWTLLLIPCTGILRLPFKPLRDLTAFLLSLNYAVLITLLFQRIL